MGPQQSGAAAAARGEGKPKMTVVQIGQPERRRRPSLLGRRVTPGLAVLVIGAIAVLRIWVVETAFVEGQSMETSLHTGDRVLVLKPLHLKRLLREYLERLLPHGATAPGPGWGDADPA